MLPSGAPASRILIGQRDGKPDSIAIDPLIAAATEHAADLGIDADDRIVMPMPLHSLHGLACGLGRR